MGWGHVTGFWIENGVGRGGWGTPGDTPGLSGVRKWLSGVRKWFTGVRGVEVTGTGLASHA
jgi:hypothetical protein